MVPELATLRGAIDRLDATIANVLVKRARLAQRVALRKRLGHEPDRDVRRELEVRDHYASRLGPIGWSEGSIDTLLGTMLHASRDLQARLRVAIQGGPGSWSEISLQANLPRIEVLHCDTVRDVETACRSGAAVAAWLARQNSTVGPIQETDEAASTMDAWLVAEHPIRHALLGRKGLALASIKVIRGHPRALEQCRATLARIAPQAPQEATVDGAHSAASISTSDAVLGAPEIAKRHGLSILAESVNDEPLNSTTFELLVPRDSF
ncbi:MAG TPA: prephenate dehydratase domain-containing protein [Candidatus Thermoplasmatota archaeon]|nr:prephenate dehydratase domain-containing protein [Candidatus Thermoplasmatota archaeon]